MNAPIFKSPECFLLSFMYCKKNWSQIRKKELISSVCLQVSIEIIYISVQSFVYSLILFSMIDFGWSAGKFFWFFFLTFMCFIYFTLYGMMAVALTPSYQVAGVVCSFFYSFWNLFCGFVIPRKVCCNFFDDHRLNSFSLLINNPTLPMDRNLGMLISNVQTSLVKLVLLDKLGT